MTGRKVPDCKASVRTRERLSIYKPEGKLSKKHHNSSWFKYYSHMSNNRLINQQPAQLVSVFFAAVSKKSNWSEVWWMARKHFMNSDTTKKVKRILGDNFLESFVCTSFKTWPIINSPWKIHISLPIPPLLINLIARRRVSRLDKRGRFSTKDFNDVMNVNVTQNFEKRLMNNSFSDDLPIT